MTSIQDMLGKICVITGANSGIGFETCIALAQRGADLLMVCRDPIRGESARQKIIATTGHTKIKLYIADMSLLESVRTLAQKINTEQTQIHVLIHNAGVMNMKRTLTPEGFEEQYAVHHLGPFLLTHLLLDTLKRSQPARIINVTSKMHRMSDIEFDNLQAERKFGPFKTYAASKLANIMMTYQLAEQLQGTGVSVNCLHPGVIGSNLGSTPRFVKIFMKSPKKGAETPVYLASAPEVKMINGKYFMDKKMSRTSKISYNKEKIRKLWQLTCSQAGITTPSEALHG